MSDAAELRARADEAFFHARQEQGAGNLDEAKGRYEKILRQVPFHAESMTMLGSICYQQGDDAQGEAYIDRAIEIYLAVLSQHPEATAARAPAVNLLLARGRQTEAERWIGDLLLPLNPVRSTPEAFVQRRREAIEAGRPSILINTVPKSASESIWNRLAEGLGLAQCHLSLGIYPDCCLLPSRVAAAAEGGLIAKEHLPASDHNVAVLESYGLNRMIFHVRDPRQATLSWAHFVRDDVAMRLMAPIWRKIVPSADLLKEGFPPLLDWCIDVYLPQLIEFIQGWQRVEAAPERPLAVTFFSFEEFLARPQEYFAKALAVYGIDAGSFRADVEAEVVHLRRGLVDEWRQAMTPAQQERAWKLIPPDLTELFGWRR